MATRKVTLKDQLGRVIRIPVAAPPTDRPTSTAKTVHSSPAVTPATQPNKPTPAATIWRLIREVPANLQKLAGLSGVGFAVRGSDGAWHQRSITPGEGIEVEVGNGVDADPVVSLAPVMRPAAQTVSALRLLSESSAGVTHLDPTDADSVAGMLGLSITAGTAGATIKIKTAGTIDDTGWSWTPGFVFAGPAGTLTQTPPLSGWEIVVGHAPSATRLNLTLDEPVKLA